MTLALPLTPKSGMVKSEPFFFMKEDETALESDLNSETQLSIEEIKGDLAKYKLKPVTGKQHQLRIHMMSIGHPILNDPFYPNLLPCKGENYSNPLQLLAKSIRFDDPISGETREFKSERQLIF